MSSEESLDVYCQIVELRGSGNSYNLIGYKLGLTLQQICNKVGKLKYYYKSGTDKRNMLDRVAHRMDLTKDQVLKALKTKAHFHNLNADKPFMVKIKNTISSTEIWYYSFRGQELEVKKQDGLYYTNTPAKLKIKPRDCEVV